MVHWSSFPPELLHQVFTTLKREDQRRAAKVCGAWRCTALPLCAGTLDMQELLRAIAFRDGLAYSARSLPHLAFLHWLIFHQGFKRPLSRQECDSFRLFSPFVKRLNLEDVPVGFIQGILTSPLPRPLLPNLRILDASRLPTSDQLCDLAMSSLFLHPGLRTLAVVDTRPSRRAKQPRRKLDGFVKDVVDQAPNIANLQLTHASDCPATDLPLSSLLRLPMLETVMVSPSYLTPPIVSALSRAQRLRRVLVDGIDCFEPRAPPFDSRRAARRRNVFSAHDDPKMFHSPPFEPGCWTGLRSYSTVSTIERAALFVSNQPSVSRELLEFRVLSTGSSTSQAAAPPSALARDSTPSGESVTPLVTNEAVRQLLSVLASNCWQLTVLHLNFVTPYRKGGTNKTPLASSDLLPLRKLASLKSLILLDRRPLLLGDYELVRILAPLVRLRRLVLSPCPTLHLEGSMVDDQPVSALPAQYVPESASVDWFGTFDPPPSLSDTRTVELLLRTLPELRELAMYLDLSQGQPDDASIAVPPGAVGQLDVLDLGHTAPPPRDSFRTDAFVRYLGPEGSLVSGYESAKCSSWAHSVTPRMEQQVYDLGWDAFDSYRRDRSALGSDVVAGPGDLLPLV